MKHPMKHPRFHPRIHPQEGSVSTRQNGCSPFRSSQPLMAEPVRAAATSPSRRKWPSFVRFRVASCALVCACFVRRFCARCVSHFTFDLRQFCARFAQQFARVCAQEGGPIWPRFRGCVEPCERRIHTRLRRVARSGARSLSARFTLPLASVRACSRACSRTRSPRSPHSANCRPSDNSPARSKRHSPPPSTGGRSPSA